MNFGRERTVRKSSARIAGYVVSLPERVVRSAATPDWYAPDCPLYRSVRSAGPAPPEDHPRAALRHADRRRGHNRRQEKLCRDIDQPS